MDLIFSQFIVGKLKNSEGKVYKYPLILYAKKKEPITLFG